MSLREFSHWLASVLLFPGRSEQSELDRDCSCTLRRVGEVENAEGGG